MPFLCGNLSTQGCFCYSDLGRLLLFVCLVFERLRGVLCCVDRFFVMFYFFLSYREAERGFNAIIYVEILKETDG